MTQRDTYNVGILGATGVVGQKIILLLKDHKIFRVEALGASRRSSGEKYYNVVKKIWRHSVTIPEDVGEIMVNECEPQFFTKCHVIFSGLDSKVALSIEKSFIESGFRVFTNASNFRTHIDVPICVPTVNPDHLSIVKGAMNDAGGWVVANSNCSTSGLVVTLKALIDKFGHIITDVNVVTMQAVSGAGYPGVPSMDILSNIVPYIDDEEQKIETETLKILSKYDYNEKKFHLPPIKVSASCNRVPVFDGHTLCVSVKFNDSRHISVDDIIEAFEEYNPLLRYKSLITRYPAIIVHKDQNRPQPVLDCNVNSGYSVVVGRIRPCQIFDFKYTLLCNNTVLGSAGSCILNAEIAIDLGII